MELIQNVRVAGAAMTLSAPGSVGMPWRAASPLLPEPHYMFNGVAARSATEVWAVGQTRHQPLLARWDGTSWTAAAGPPAPAELIGAALLGVACDDTGAIAVGGGFDRLAGAEVPLVRYWNGTSWSDPGPVGPGRGFVLTGVVTPPGSAAWAVGHGAGNGSVGPVLLRRSGDEWESVRPPSLGRARGRLLAVDATGGGDIWAVGAADGPRKGDRGALILHYDGRDWRRVPCPSARPLTGVLALSATDAWAVGGDQVLRWNGRRWKTVRVPAASANTVTGPSSHDVWVAGGRGELVHFDGERWTRVGSPEPLTDTAVWLAAAHADTTWIVGTRQDAGHTPTRHSHSSHTRGN